MVKQNENIASEIKKTKAFASADQTGVKDEHYDLISVLYHTLQSAETCEQYCQDAEGSGDDELAQFFRQCQEQDMQRVQQAKQILAKKFLNDQDIETSDKSKVGSDSSVTRQ